MDAVKPFLENYWWAALLGAILVVSLWRASRRLGRSAAPPFNVRRGGTHDISIKAPFRRRDFAAKAEIVRHEMAKGVVIGMAILLVGFPALAMISRFVPTLPRRSFIAALTILGIGSILAFAWRGSRLMRRSGLICHACGVELGGRAGTRLHGWSLQDRVLETGKCPQCGTQLLDPTEVGPISQTLTRAEHARAMVVVGALVVGLIAFVYVAITSVRAKELAYCAGRYARAYTAEDSVAIDSKRLHRDKTFTCGDLRRANGQ